MVRRAARALRPVLLTANGDLARIYLQDHRAGAGAGLAAARRTLDNNRGTEFEAPLCSLVDDIRADLRTLERVLDAAGVTNSRTKNRLALVGERIGRLKLNGRVREYSPLSRVLEFEALEAGINTKRMLWRTLGAAQPDRPELARFDFADLERRAVDQSRRLEPLHVSAVLLAFLVGADRDASGRDQDLTDVP